MRTRRVAVVSALTAVSMLVICACGATGENETGKSGATVTGLRIMVPNTPGGGYDTAARAAAKVLEDTKIAPGVEVFNLPGAGGTVGLQRTVSERGNGNLAMQMGLGVVGASYTSKSNATLADTTPIARMMEEAGAIVVPEDSPYKSITDLVTAWKANPKAVAVGGGSSVGGPDHLLSMQLAKTVGINPKKVKYISYDGGGELLPSILHNKISFGASGFGEFIDQIEAGQVRVLAVTSEKPIDVLKGTPTLKSSGINLVFTNWRGIIAPPGISGADRKVWIDSLTAMHDSAEWKAELTKHGWTDAFMTGFEFSSYLTEQDRDVADILTELGLA